MLGLKSEVWFRKVVGMKDTENEVCIDIRERQQCGFQKYGRTVAGNPLSLREWLQHAYEETLDQAVYLKRAIQELDGGP